ncbi:MAG: hypothetical protein ABH834_07590 [Candidatus Altiarchaeota archaeon]
MRIIRQSRGHWLPKIDPKLGADLADPPILGAVDVARLRLEGRDWLDRVDSGDLSNVKRTGEGLVLPLKGNIYADRVLFMLTHAGEHVFARCIGSVDETYTSNLIHGVMDDGKIVFDDKPLFSDGLAREDPRAMLIEGKMYLTYTSVHSDIPDDFSVGLSIIDDPSKPHEIREVGQLIKIPEPGLHCKDSVLITEKVDGKYHVLIRLKPGIQDVAFDSLQDIENLAKNPEYRDAFWANVRRQYRKNPGDFNHLHPNTPEMMLWEARWKPLFDRQINLLTSTYPERDHFNINPDTPYWYGSGPTPLKVEEDGEKYWLSFPHRGQVIGRLTEEGIMKRNLEKRREEDLKFYCILATLHEFEDPRKLTAVSPIPLLMPTPQRVSDRGIQAHVDPLMGSDAVPFVYITAGSMRTQRDGRLQIQVPIGVNDMYTIIKYFDEKELLGWMMREGKL